MAESGSKSEDQRPKIIIDAKGTEKEVPPKSEQKGEEEEKERDRGDFGKGVVAGAIGGKVAERLINEGAKFVRRKLYGGTGERRRLRERTKKEEDPIHNASFAKVMSMSNDQTLTGEERGKWINEKNSRVEEFKKFDEGDFVADTQRRFQTIMRTSEWDAESGKGVYDGLISYAEERDREYGYRHEAIERHKGLIGIAIRAEAARVLVAGIENKFEGMNEQGKSEWLKSKNYSDNEVKRLGRLSTENHIFDFATDAPEEFVGAALEKKEEVLPEEGLLGLQREGKQSLREVPLYFGAVFKGGKNEVYVDRLDLIPTLDITNENDRTRFIFKNIHAFDYRFGKGSAWKGAIEDWVKDANIADEISRIDPEVKAKFLGRLKSMMAVTASARAMEASAGVAKSYLINLVGANERGEPNLDEQDLSTSLLLHADPEKMITVLKDPVVRTYYGVLMDDAGLVNNSYLEWRQFKDPDNPDKKIQVASKAVFVDDNPKLTRERSRLITYLKNSAEEGGFQGYIDEVLVKIDRPELVGMDKDSRMAAARIACDAFLVDKWTRWEDVVTEGGKESLDLQPIDDWGGDPLKSILKPTFLPRLKKVYTNEKDEPILNLVEAAIKPDDIFARIKENAGEYEDVSKIHPLVPSMVTNLKFISRLSDATYKVFGGSMAAGLPNWSPKMMQEELPQMADLLTQVYGNLSVKEKKTSRKIPIGKHIVGAMMMRVLHAKALAAAIESSKPEFGESLQIILDPQNRNRPFLEIMQYLYGANFDSKSGFIQSLAGGRTRLVIKDNMFDAERSYRLTYNVLQTNDQGGGNRARTLNQIGMAVDILKNLGESFGVVKR